MSLLRAQSIVRTPACGHAAPCIPHPRGVQHIDSHTLHHALCRSTAAGSTSHTLSRGETESTSASEAAAEEALLQAEQQLESPATFTSVAARAVGAMAVALALIFGPCDPASAARTGGRISGGFHHGLHRVKPASTSNRLAHFNSRTAAATWHSKFAGHHVMRTSRLPAFHMHPGVALLALTGANVAGLWGVMALLRLLGDTSEPVTVVKLQVGLLTKPSKVQKHLSELCCMIKAGARGRWLILEEALLTMASDTSACAFADTAVVHTLSKAEAYDIFQRLAASEAAKAAAEEQHLLAHSPSSPEPQTPKPFWSQLASTLPLAAAPAAGGAPLARPTTTAYSTIGSRRAGVVSSIEDEDDYGEIRAPDFQQQGEQASEHESRSILGSILDATSSIFDALLPGAHAGSSEASEAVVVTLVVAARGRLEVPAAGSWLQLRHAMQVLGGLSSERIMAIELLWTPQAGEGVLTKGEMLQDYPNLQALQ